MHAGNHLDQSGFAGAIFAEQCLDLSAANRQGDVFNHVNGTERLRDINELENGPIASIIVSMVGHRVHLLEEVLGRKFDGFTRDETGLHHGTFRW